MKEEELQESVLLVFANKQDLPNAYSVSELTEHLGLRNFKARQVNVLFHCLTNEFHHSYMIFDMHCISLWLCTYEFAIYHPGFSTNNVLD